MTWMPQDSIEAVRAAESLFSEEGTYDAYLDSMMVDPDNTADLRHVVQRTARLKLELLDGGPMRDYLLQIRAESVAAIRALLWIDLSTETVKAVELQQIARRYAHVCEHIIRILDEGKQADQQIQEQA